MSHTISIQQASTQLGELVRSLRPNDEIVLTDNDRPVARIVPSPSLPARKAGLWKRKVSILNDGDEQILEHFAKYMP